MKEWIKEISVGGLFPHSLLYLSLTFPQSLAVLLGVLPGSAGAFSEERRLFFREDARRAAAA